MDREDRRAEFITAAYELFDEKGVAKTSVGDITKRVGVARSLFYHYFPDKNTITTAVIDHNVDEFVSRLQAWTKTAQHGNIYDMLLSVVQIIRSFLHGSDSLSGFVMREGDAALFQRFAIGSARHLGQLFANSKARPGSLKSYTNVQHPYESFYVLSLGIISLLNHEPNVADEVIVDLTVDTLGIELTKDQLNLPKG